MMCTQVANSVILKREQAFNLDSIHNQYFPKMLEITYTIQPLPCQRSALSFYNLVKSYEQSAMAR